MLSSRANRLIILIAIVLAAVVLRDTAVRRLPVDFDEPVYMWSAYAYAEAIRAGDLNLLADDPSPEHPGLVKLVDAAVQLRLPPPPADLLGEVATADEIEAFASDPANRPWLEQIEAMFLSTRRVSALFGVLHVLLLALVSPAAGALLAVHSYTVKYTAQVYLEAVPMFTATVCVLSYMQAGRSSRKGRQGSEGRQEEQEMMGRNEPGHPWHPALFWAISAVALGLTAAGKYIYAVAGLAVAADTLWRLAEARRPRGLPVLLGWGGLALLVFLAANPAFWGDPFGRLFDSLAFHAAYSQGAHVAESGYPWYQPFVWLVAPLPVSWHPGIILVGLDPLTVALGVAGLWPMVRAYGGRGRVIALWWAIGLAFTLLWSTKWPQYSLIMTAPMCLCAAEGLRVLWRRLPESVREALTSQA
jgi:hypothetical protein